MKRFKYGFTLAETLITLSILGIVAAITIPSLVGRQIESQNRTKLKKAMTMYEKAINNMLIENDLQTETAFQTWAKTDATTNNYQEQRGYFKIAEESTSNPNCRFKTADRIWWDICGTNDSNIENPIIILDEKYKDTDRSELETLAKTEKVDGKKVYVYALVGRKDATTGAVRVNDKAYETGSPNKEYLEKVYAFLEKREMIVSNETKNPIEVCKENNQDYCEVNGIIYKKYSISDPSEYKCNDPNMCYIDPAISAYCNPYTTNRVKYSELPEDTTELYVAAPIELTDEEIEEADGNYRLAGENKCKSSGGHLASFAEVNVASKNGDYKADWYCFRETVKGPCCRASNGGGSLKCTTTSATKGGKIICAY